MEIIGIPTEQTTAATDLLLALVALACAGVLMRRPLDDKFRRGLWIVNFGLLTVAATLGAIAHGLVLPEATVSALWQPLYLSLGLLVALFVVAAVHDMWGRKASRRALPFMLAVGVGFYAYTLLVPGSFFVFILYEGIGMLAALAIYGWLLVKGHLPGAGWMVAGVLITIIAAGVQASKAVHFTLIWQFDHNGVYHLIQIVGAGALIRGVMGDGGPLRSTQESEERKDERVLA